VAKGLQRCLDKQSMFTFVRDFATPDKNSVAERAIRPAVITCKISGGRRTGRELPTTLT